MSKNKGLGRFITGAFIGAGLGVLFAPKKGSDTRKELKEKSVEVMDQIKHTSANDVKKILDKKLKELKKEFENLNKETAKDMIKEKANLLIDKADELLELAKEKSAPVIEKATKEVKDKTIDILNAAVDKLEGSNTKQPVKKNNTKTANKKSK